eukprot:PhM_4_TR9822/c1_g1_i1/m.79039
MRKDVRRHRYALTTLQPAASSQQLNQQRVGSAGQGAQSTDPDSMHFIPSITSEVPATPPKSAAKSASTMRRIMNIFGGSKKLVPADTAARAATSSSATPSPSRSTTTSSASRPSTLSKASPQLTEVQCFDMDDAVGVTSTSYSYSNSNTTSSTSVRNPLLGAQSQHTLNTVLSRLGMMDVSAAFACQGIHTLEELRRTPKELLARLVESPRKRKRLLSATDAVLNSGISNLATPQQPVGPRVLFTSHQHASSQSRMSLTSTVRTPDSLNDDTSSTSTTITMPLEDLGSNNTGSGGYEGVASLQGYTPTTTPIIAPSNAWL